MIRFDEAAEKIGVDASRYIYLSAPPTNDVRFGYSLGEDARRRLLAFWNIIVFFDLYYQIDKPDLRKPLNSNNLSDKWLNSRINKFINEVKDSYEDYETSAIIKSFERCVDDVSNWYIRINRKRFWKSDMNEDKLSAYSSLYQAIKKITKVMAPIIPFMSDWIWVSLIIKVEKETNSIHLSQFPTSEEYDENLLEDVEIIREVITSSLKLRNEKNLKVKQPLSVLYLVGYHDSNITQYEDILKSELNVKEIEYLETKDSLREEYMSLEFKKAGMVLKGNVNNVKDLLLELTAEEMKEVTDSYKEEKDVTLGDYSFPSSILKLNYNYKNDLAVFEDNQKLVALNTALDSELIDEGIYRELLRQCQLIRKEAGFDIADRIIISVISKDNKIDKVLKKYSLQLEEETLSTFMETFNNPVYEKTISIDDSDIVIKMKLK